MKTLTAADYLTRIPVLLAPDQTADYARMLMHEHRIHHLPVLSDGRAVGMVSQRDLLVLDAATADTSDVPVERVMARNPYVADVGDDLATLAREMIARHIGSSIITREGQVVGVFTTTDALRALADSLSS